MATVKVSEEVPFYGGAHELPKIDTLDVELPRGTSQFRRIFDRIFNQLRSILTDTPEYDSGYFKITTDSIYYMDHAIGSVPRRATLYYTNVYPDSERNYVWHMNLWSDQADSNGISLLHRLDGQRSQISTRATTLYWSHTDAWIRVMLWR